MALTRVWTPSGNYSGGSKKRLIVIHTMEGFTGSNGAYDCAKYFQGNVGASSQVCIDNNRGKIWECVNRSNGAWTQCNYNSVSVSAEQSGYASWSRDYWHSNRSNQLHNMADWIAEEAGKLGIPITKISNPNSSGVIYHSELGSTGCGHSDPGSGYPINDIIAWAKGGSSPPTEQPPSQPGTSAPPFPFPSDHYLGRESPDPCCHSGYYSGDQTHVRTWQGQMANRGWSISVDGYYGDQSYSICTQFQAEKNLAVDGMVGPNTWNTSWTAPIT
jgi:peptidoglycan hydrolase-like protein with peptidoglycan-binding domain